MLTTTDDDRRAVAEFKLALMQSGIDRDTLVYDLTDDEMAALVLAAERRGMERALAIVDEHVCQHCAHIAAAIRAEITNTKGTDQCVS